MSVRDIRVGVIGIGHLGQHHARIYSSLPGVKLVGLSDRDLARANRVGERLQVPTFRDYLDLLDTVDAVSVAVPTSFHSQVVGDCLRKGIHVLVEKPLASTCDEGRALVDLANDAGARLQVGHVERFNPVLDKVRPVLSHPTFIQCNRLAPFQTRGTDVDVVLDLMIHDLDIVLSWRLGPVAGVSAYGNSVMSDHYDFVTARIEFESGCIVQCTASRVSTVRLRNFCVFQPNLYLVADYQSRQGVLYRKEQSARGPTSVVEECLEAGSEDALTRELAAFARSLHDGVDYGVSGEEGLNALYLAFDLLASAGKKPRPTETKIPAIRTASVESSSDGVWS